MISNKSHTLYCGITTDLLGRFEEHRSGAYENAFTRRYQFDRLMWFETAADLIAAGHGPQLTVIVTGIPAGLKLDRDNIQRDMRRRHRQHGYPWRAHEDRI
jgi:hypothetical protein